MIRKDAYYTVMQPPASECRGLGRSRKAILLQIVGNTVRRGCRPAVVYALAGHSQLKRTAGRRKAIFLRGEVTPQRLSWRSRAKPRRRAGAKRGGSRR